MKIHTWISRTKDCRVSNKGEWFISFLLISSELDIWQSELEWTPFVSHNLIAILHLLDQFLNQCCNVNNGHYQGKLINTSRWRWLICQIGVWSWVEQQIHGTLKVSLALNQIPYEFYWLHLCYNSSIYEKYQSKGFCTAMRMVSFGPIQISTWVHVRFPFSVDEG